MIVIKNLNGKNSKLSEELPLGEWITSKTFTCQECKEILNLLEWMAGIVSEHLKTHMMGAEAIAMYQQYQLLKEVLERTQK